MTDEKRPPDLHGQRPVNWRVWANQLPHRRRSFEGGNLLALYDALEECELAGIPLPQWVLEGLRTLFVETVHGKAKGKQGRGNALIGDARKALIWRQRNLTVSALRECQTHKSSFLGIPRDALTNLIRLDIREFGTTMDDAFELASRILAGTNARGSESAMRKAWYSKPDVNGLNAKTLMDFGLVPANEYRNRRLPEFMLNWLREDAQKFTRKT